MPSFLNQQRSVATVVILTFITCGIYGLWYIYNLTASLAQEV
jgi:hypothetical protein